MQTVYGDQDYKWSSKLIGVVLQPSTTVEMAALKARFISENNPSQDGTLACLAGSLYVWDNISQDWVSQVSEGVDLSYTHSQSVALSTWPVTHNLGKYPSVTVIDSAGTEVEGAVQHLSTTQLVITFSAPFGGTAHLN